MRKVLAVIPVLLALSLATPPIFAEPLVAGAAIVEGAKTTVLINSIRTLINDAIDKAQNTGNYLLFKNGTELKSVIDTWEKANSTLLDKTFRELNDSQRRFFSEANSSAQKLNQDVTAQMEAATKIAELLNQTLADVRIFDGGLALFRYAPRIVYPGMTGEISFTVRGVNFDDADPQLTLQNGNTAKRVSLSKQEAVFVIPSSAFSYQPEATSFAKLTLSYLNPSDGFFGRLADFFNGRKERRSTEIAVMQLPQQLGTYVLQYRTRDTIRDTWDGEREFYWSGRDESRIETQGPHDNGWRMDIASLHQGRVWGEAGRGCYVQSNNEHGFAIEIRVGRISTILNPNAPGYQHCIWHWKEYMERQVINDQPPSNGKIGWTNDIPITLPANRESFVLRIRTWSGLERAIAGSQTEPFYQVSETGNTVIIRPQIPNDLNGI